MTKNKNKDIKKVFAPTAKSRTNTNKTTTTNYTENVEESQEAEINLYKIHETRQERYIKMPLELFYGYYSSLSCEAKVLYGLLLDRMELSRENNWINEKGEIYLIFSREEIQKILHISQPTCTKAFKQLTEKKLIVEKRQGLNKPNLIFIAHIDYEFNNKYASNADKQRNQIFFGSKPKNFLGQEEKNFCPNKTNNNKTNNNKSSLSSLSISEDIKDKTGQDEPHRQTPSMPSIETCQQYLKDNINYEELKTTHPQDMPLVDECIQIMLDTIFTNKPGVRINRENKPKELVVSTLMKVTCADIVHVIYQFNNQTTPIKRKAAYILTMLYMSTLERHAHYKNMVRSDWGAIRGLIDRK